MPFQNKTVVVEDSASDSDLSSNRPRQKPTITVVARQQTADEQHRFRAATDALLAELVRRQLGRGS